MRGGRGVRPVDDLHAQLVFGLILTQPGFRPGFSQHGAGPDLRVQRIVETADASGIRQQLICRAATATCTTDSFGVSAFAPATTFRPTCKSITIVAATREATPGSSCLQLPPAATTAETMGQAPHCGW
jgi:hypothetical protein